MKKVLALACIAMLAACTPKSSGAPKEAAQATEAPSTASFETYLNTLPVADEKSISKAVEYFQSNFKKEDKANNDRAYAAFLTFQQKVADTLSSKLSENPDLEYDPTLEDDQQRPALKKWMQELEANGLQILFVHGATFVAAKTAYLEKSFGEYISPAMKEYLAQEKQDEEKPAFYDGRINISLEEFADRTVQMEKFNAKYPDFAMKDRAAGWYKFYLSSLLSGSDSPVPFEEETLNTQFKDAYAYIAKTYPDTETGKVIAEYNKVLAKAGYKKTAEVDAFIGKYKME